MAYDYIVESTDIAAGTLLLTLKPESASDHFPFAPGQYASIGFRRGGRPTPVRCFSMASSPNETRLQFGMRIHGRFTRTAARLQPGDKVYVHGPFGEFTFSEDDRHIVMLAGGIGITPFISMLRYATEMRLPQNVTLLFTNRTIQNAPCAAEIMELAAKNPRLRVYFFNTGEDEVALAPPSVRFMRGQVTQAHLQRLADGSYAGSTYFICGPKGFMKNMQKGLQRQGVDESYIVTESFASGSKHAMLGGFSAQSMTYGLTAASMIAMTGFIMFLDLSRANSVSGTAAKAKTAQNAASSTTTTASTPSTSTTAVPSAPSTPASNTGSASSSSSPSSNSSSSSNTSTQSTYQQPTSSVS